MSAGTPIGQRPVLSPFYCVERVEQAVNWVGFDAELIPVGFVALFWIEAFDTHQYVHRLFLLVAFPHPAAPGQAQGLSHYGRGLINKCSDHRNRTISSHVRFSIPSCPWR